MSAARARIAGVMRLELLIQRREPLTALYALVLGLLAAAFAAAGPVELVRGRGAVPRDAAWSLMLASTALTAFGQVITTMVAATVVLRDRQDRVSDLLAASRLTGREYLLGKLGAALVLLCVIYAAIPVGLAMGATLAGGSLSGALWRSLVPFALVVLPTMLAVGALQFGIGVLSGRLWVIVGQGLLLIWCWSAAVDASGDSGVSALTLMADPFGSAPLLHATRAWSDADRATRALPVSWPLLAGRLAWLTVGTSLAGWAVLRGARVQRRAGGAARGAATPSADTAADATDALRQAVAVRAPIGVGALARRPRQASAVRAPVGVGALALAPRPQPWRGAVATTAYVRRWMLRDTGWRVLALLGATNVAVHACLDARAARGAEAVTRVALASLQLHARLFLILLATIYAGELVWREREERSAPLFDVLPTPTSARVLGSIAGVIVAQTALVLLLSAAAGLAVMTGAGQLPIVSTLLREVAAGVLGPFVVWMLVALAVHVLVQHKVVSHLLCIAGWVLAVLLAGAAEPGASQLPVPAQVAVAVLALAVARWRWPRGVLPTRRTGVVGIQGDASPADTGVVGT